MLFEKVNKEHILKGIKDFNEKGLPNGYGPSSTFDLIHEGKRYPPKAIMAFANFHASVRKIEPYFKRGDKNKCFKVLRGEDFQVTAKE